MTATDHNSNQLSATKPISDFNPDQLIADIHRWATDLGFDAIGISNTELAEHEEHLQRWLQKGFHGTMDYMRRHGTKRSRPHELVEGTISVISARIDYAPDNINESEQILEQTQLAYISRYALGRDYHKVLRKKLQQLAQKMTDEVGQFGYRVFTDSAPVLEKAIAQQAGLGWIGKHTNLIDSKTGSWFFIGEIYVDFALPTSAAASNHCGSCQRCIDLCPTNAIVAPYQVDARRCISYLTIELRESIPVEFRRAMGNRIYGCDDCQLVCPWNKFAQHSKESDFSPREYLTDRELLELFSWDEAEFLRNTEGTAIRRIGFECWQRNIAVALGNAAYSEKIISALIERKDQTSEMVNEHIDWALAEQQSHKRSAENLTSQAQKSQL